LPSPQALHAVSMVVPVAYPTTRSTIRSETRSDNPRAVTCNVTVPAVSSWPMLSIVTVGCSLVPTAPTPANTATTTASSKKERPKALPRPVSLLDDHNHLQKRWRRNCHQCSGGCICHCVPTISEWDPSGVITCTDDAAASLTTVS